LPALPQPAVAAPGLSHLRHLCRARGHRAQGRRALGGERDRLRVAGAAGAAVTVAVDGFGAEQGFEALAEGARLAAAHGIGVRVFGPERALGLDGADGIEIVPTSEWISNQEEPVPAVREKKEASVVRAARDVAEGGAEAMVSC